MAEMNTDIPNQPFDPDQILQEAKQRWFQPTEVCQIITNYEKFEQRTKVLKRPPGGSLFLYNTNEVKYFCKDGHNWMKKAGNGTVKEDHETVELGGEHVIRCFYARGESDANFQRRCYRMIDRQFENIALVHYREVKEGRMSDVPRVLNADSGTLVQRCQSSQQTTSVDQTFDISYDFGCLFGSELDENAFNPNPDTYMFKDVDGSMKNAIRAEYLSHKLTDFTRLDDNVCHSEDLFSSGTGFSLPHSGSEGIHPSVMNTDNDDDTGRLKKVDSFDKWMDNSLITEPSYWDVLETEKDKNQVSSLSHHIQMDMDFVGPSLVNEHLFSIRDFAPDCAYSGIETTVLITGIFLGEKKRMRDIKWCCMFGEMEVMAEAVTENAIRCKVPVHDVGRVSFYLTNGNRIACSEVKEFEYVIRPSRLEDSGSDADAEDEFGLLVRFSKMLSSGIERKWLACLVENCEKCKLKDVFHSLIIDEEGCWKRTSEVFKGNSKELLIQNLLKDKLYERLVCEAHESCKGLRTLDEKGQSVIHLAAALGYEWAISPIAGAGLSPNFRDARGWTALHWASLYGREETIVTLVKLGAFAGAVDNPTPKNPGGQTAADLAASKGHKGIAGYLAEAALMSLLSALSVKDMDVVGKEIEEHGGSVAAAAAAVSRSEHATALIQESFRARFFHKKQVSTSSMKNSNLTPQEEGVAAAAAAASSHRFQKSGHSEDYMGVSALGIQRKYRAWRYDKDFLKVRDRIVNIQAHVRGHQARKHYKKVVWSVGILEKVILRWRRKGQGLRGFRSEVTYPSAVEKGEYDYLQIGQIQKHDGVKNALAMVHSMASHSQAQDQYLRMLRMFEKLSHEEKKEDSRGRDYCWCK